MRIKMQSAALRKQIPRLPGVYFFRNSAGKILYIGKASNLHSRIGSYFVKNNSSLKTASLLKESAEVDWQILNSEVEALIKEAELIKKHMPKYNVLMRDDKNYFYVGFTKETYPKIFITHQPQTTHPGKRDNISFSSPSLKKGGGRGRDIPSAKFLGPFTEGNALRSVLKTLRKAFPYCTCLKPHKNLCLNARIGRCFGFCCTPLLNPLLNKEGTGEVYKKNISAIKQILSGKNMTLVRGLKKEMHRLSDARKYEEAGKIRDQIRSLERIFEHHMVIKQDLPSENIKALNALEAMLGIGNIDRIEAYDIANIHGKFAYGSMAVLENGIIKKDDYRLFKIRSVPGSNDPAMLREVLMRRFRHPEWPYPQVIIVDGGKPQLNATVHAIFNRESEQHSYFRMRVGAPVERVKREKIGMLRAGLKIIALTKNKKHVGDHIYIGGRSLPISLDKLPPPLKNLILNLDSEAHRFAISRYRKAHRKSLTSPSGHANLVE